MKQSRSYANDMLRLLSRMKPLIAAEASSFVLIQKNQKIKTEKTFSPQGQLPARFSVGPLRFLSTHDFSFPVTVK